MKPRRELRVAVGLCLVGSALLLVAASATWVRFQELSPAGPLTTSASGREVDGLVPALGWVGLAGVVALAATRAWGRVLTGILLLLAGLGAVATCVSDLRTRAGSLVLDPLDGVSGVANATVVRGWMWLALSGGVLLAAAGGLVTVRGRGWAALSATYEAPVRDAPPAPAGDKALWDALDRGDDPTA